MPGWRPASGSSWPRRRARGWRSSRRHRDRRRRAAARSPRRHPRGGRSAARGASRLARSSRADRMAPRRSSKWCATSVERLVPDGVDRLVDLYAGVGLFAGSIAGDGGHRGRVESNSSVGDARHNLGDAARVIRVSGGGVAVPPCRRRDRRSEPRGPRSRRRRPDRRDRRGARRPGQLRRRVARDATPARCARRATSWSRHAGRPVPPHPPRGGRQRRSCAVDRRCPKHSAHGAPAPANSP